MKGTTVVYIDAKGAEHDALVRATNPMHPGYITVAYVDESAPEGDNVTTVYDVVHMDDPSKAEPNPNLPTIHLNVWMERYRIHGEAAPDHPMFDRPYEEKQKDEFGKVIEKARPQWEAQIAAHQASLPSADDLDAVAAEEAATKATDGSGNAAGGFIDAFKYTVGRQVSGNLPPRQSDNPSDVAPEEQKAQEDEAQGEAEYGQAPDSERDYPKRADGSLDR